MESPLSYKFGTVSEIFHCIYEESKAANLFISSNETSQTMQLYLTDEDCQNKKNYIGAIQYEGSNNFDLKPPHIVSWRFKRANLPDKLKSTLERITEFRKDNNSGPSINPNAESIAFKFEALNQKTAEVIRKIGQTFLYR